MSSDPLLKAAIAHWGPRFVANGVVLTLSLIHISEPTRPY